MTTQGKKEIENNMTVKSILRTGIGGVNGNKLMTRQSEFDVDGTSLKNRIVGSNVYKVEILATTTLKEANAERLKYYDGKQHDPIEEVKRVVVLNGGQVEVYRTLGIRLNNYHHELKIW